MHNQSTLDLNEVVNTIIDGAHENIYHLSYSTWYPTEINVAYNNDLFVEKSYVVFKPNKKNVCLEYLEKNTSVESEDYLYYQIKKIYINNMQSNNWLKKITNWEPNYGGIQGFKKGLRITIDWFNSPENLKFYSPNTYKI